MSQIRLKKLNKFFDILSIIIFTFISLSKILSANEPVDIWKNAEEKQNEQQEEKVLVESQNKIDLSKIKTEDQKQIEILEEGGANKSDIKLVGLFDPQENDLNLDMWSNTDGETIKSTFKRIEKIKLSKFSEEMFVNTIMTYSYSPKNKLSDKEFLKLKIISII